MERYATNYGEKRVQYIQRNTKLDRIDRIRWRDESCTEKIDSHIFINSFYSKVWKNILPLIKCMYKETSSEYLYITNYRERFLKTL